MVDRYSVFSPREGLGQEIGSLLAKYQFDKDKLTECQKSNLNAVQARSLHSLKGFFQPIPWTSGPSTRRIGHRITGD